jgi:energy-coupling factor transport system ATP-binding protein
MTIRLSDATYRYPDGTLAVESVDLEIAEGERVAIVGQNGAGKTTTVKMMNGLLRPTSGSVLVDGDSIAERTTAQISRSVGYVFQNPDDQIFGSDVQAELEFVAKRSGWDETTRLERVRRAAVLAGLGNVMELNPNDLPFAVKKFVAIGAILVGRCRYLILDEPTAGLDGRGLRLLSRMIERLEAEGIGIITITHDMRFVADEFQRVVAMAHRRIIADGDVRDVFADAAVMREARLRRPEAAALSQDLGLDPRALSIDEIAALIP